MKYALIGCGRIATNHIKAALDNNLDIVAVCDIDESHLLSLLDKHNLKNNSKIKQYSDYKKMLQEEKPVLVSVATESGKHAQIALDCIQTGCNVIIEKPISLSLEDADEIIDQAKKAGVKVCACHQNRFNKSIQCIRKAVDSNRFGKMSHGSIHVRWNRNENYYHQAPWRGTWEQDGGALMNQSIHGIDLLRWMMGDEIHEIFAYTRQQFHNYLECEDVGLAVVSFKNGAIGTIEGTTNVFLKNLEETLYLFGENGTAKAGGLSANNIDVWDFSNADDEEKNYYSSLIEETENVYGNGHTALYADMIDAINNNRSPYVDANAGRRALEVVLAIYKSSSEGKPVRLPLKKCATMDFKK